MSQAANTFWDEQLKLSTKVRALARRKLRIRRLIDGLVLMILLAAGAICVSVYQRTTSEFESAVARHRAAAVKLEDRRLEAERLEREVERLRTDTKLIETLARQRLGMVRPGDFVIKVNQQASAPSQQSAIK